jgi:hypothetical protein
MTKVSKAALVFTMNQLLPDNDQQEISAEDLRNVLTDMIDSLCSNSGEVNISGKLRYSAAFLLDNALDLIYRSHLEDNYYDSTEVDTILADYIHQGTNTLTESLFLDGGGLYDVNILDANLDLNGGWLIDPSLIRYSGSTVWDVPNMVFRNTIDGNIGVDINNSRLSYGGSVKFQWDTGLFYNGVGQAVSDFDNQALKNFNGSSNVDVIDWMLGLANDFSGDPSYNWFDRELYDSWGFDAGMTTLIKTPGTGIETNGNWRISIDGDDFVIQRKESGTWNTKFSQSA